jgi:hypothetical protein
MPRAVRRGWRGASIAVVAALALSLGAGSAQAYWTAASVPGGNSAAAATTVGAGAKPTGVPTGGSVALSWAASTLASGQAVSGYTVTRYSATNVPQTVGGTCSGLVAATTCTETGVPTGTWTYTITPRFATNWTGAESAKSSNVVVDATPPTNTITLSGVTGAAVLSGTTVYYRGVAAGSFALRNAVADAETGPASSATAALTGTTTGWTHTPSTVSTPAGGPYVSATFAWAAGTTSSPGEVVTGRDVAGNTATTSLTFVNDATGPSGGSVDAVGLVGTGARYSISTSLSIAFTAGTDPTGVVLTAAQLYRAMATLTSTAGADGVCGTYGAYTAVGGVNPVSPFANTVPTAQRCYRYQYVVADGFGNSTTYTSGDIKVDTTVPSTPTLAFSGFTNTYWSGTGTTVYYRSNAASGAFTVTAASTDADSGIANYTFSALGGNWTSTPGALGVNTYSWSGGAAAAPGTRNVTATNNASRTSTARAFTMTVDNTAPSAGTTFTYVNGSTLGGAITVTFTTGTDGGSGLGTRLLQRADAPLVGQTCGTYTTPATVAGGTNPTSPFVDTVATTGHCYTYQYLVYDNVGNLRTTTSVSVAHTPYGAWWTFDEGTGTSAADSFGNANTGILQAAAGWTAGKIGTSALNLTGAPTSFVDVANPLPASLPVIDSSQSYTVATWVKLNNLTGTQTFAGIEGAQISPFYLQMTGGVFNFSQRASDSTASALVQVNGLAPTIGTWYYVVGVYDKTANTIQLYVNGVSQGTATATTAWKATGHTVVGRGRWAAASAYFVNGSLDETRFYDRALTASEIVAQGGYQSAISATAGLVNYWQFGEASGTVATDNKAAANGTYVGAPTLGAAGVITNDSNTAVTFDGATQYATATCQIANDFSIEFWFKSTQGIGTGAQWWQGAGLVDGDIGGSYTDFGTSLRSDGRVVAGMGPNPDTSIISSTAGFNDGNWHHVVFTRVMATGAMVLYVDGVSQGTATASGTAPVTTPTIYFGRVASGGGFFAGTLDEVATYSVVLSPATVAAHYAAR